MGTVATTHALFLLFLAEALLGLEFLEFSCGHGDAGGCAAVELPVGSKMGHGGHHVMIHIWQRQWTHLAFAGSGLLQGFGHHELTGNTICIFCLRPSDLCIVELNQTVELDAPFSKCIPLHLIVFKDVS
ncbi:hypothetical protein C2845_PM10G17470 [Panicum miliaceum]|uniref:Secreted protein n=1 Tax=Panicum miliaceum TaxID=4540 RepID=A0A3L6PFB5_PANMI|nr:hypothetical protein C2845_PM10G17470 [Panicum miliaceum]